MKHSARVAILGGLSVLALAWFAVTGSFSFAAKSADSATPPAAPVAWISGTPTATANVVFSSPLGYDSTTNTELIYLGVLGPSQGPNDPARQPAGTEYTIQQDTSGQEPILVGGVGDIVSWSWTGVPTSTLTLQIKSVDSRLGATYSGLPIPMRSEAAAFVMFKTSSMMPDPDVDAVFASSNSAGTGGTGTSAKPFDVQVDDRGKISITVGSNDDDAGQFNIFIPDSVIAAKAAKAGVTASRDQVQLVDSNPKAGSVILRVDRDASNPGVTKGGTPFTGLEIRYTFTYSVHQLATDANPVTPPGFSIFLPLVTRNSSGAF
ncbi:MAG: hypothetical protein Q8R28_13570 [Dehalococcoidia bacterium]|nr:hypothetical protein [Dehalococcoidia bacterium]